MLLPVAFPYKQLVSSYCIIDFHQISQSFTKPKQELSDFGMSHMSGLAALNPAISTVTLGSQIGILKPSAELFCGSYQVALGPLPGGPRFGTPGGQLQTKPELSPGCLQGQHTRGLTPELPKANRALWNQPLHHISSTVVTASPTTNQPKGQSLLLMCKQQPRLKYNRASTLRLAGIAALPDM